MKHDDPTYINTDPFMGDEAEITLREIRMVNARKEHDCYSLTGAQDHTIKVGERHRYERALIDGDHFGSFRFCILCLDKFIAGDY
ncbi:hypothetical protein D9M68_123640 [compost metagenome]